MLLLLHRANYLELWKTHVASVVFSHPLMRKEDKRRLSCVITKVVGSCLWHHWSIPVFLSKSLLG